MHSVPNNTPTLRLLGRDGQAWNYTTLSHLARDLVGGGYYSRGGLYGLHTAIVERFTTSYDAWTGQRIEDGQYVVETLDGERLSRAAIAQACIDYRWAHRRKTRAGGRGWYKKPRRHKRITKYDLRHAIHHRLDLVDLDPDWGCLVGPKLALDDPYEAAPRRTPQRSWKSHRAHQHH